MKSSLSVSMISAFKVRTMIARLKKAKRDPWQDQLLKGAEERRKISVQKCIDQTEACDHGWNIHL